MNAARPVPAEFLTQDRVVQIALGDQALQVIALPHDPLL
jgi:hypothetical protein